jgi:hypothetical protein
MAGGDAPSDAILGLPSVVPNRTGREPGRERVSASDLHPELRLALGRRDAAAALGMSLRHFQRHVQPHLRCVYSGQLRLFPVAELERWVSQQTWPPDPET